MKIAIDTNILIRLISNDDKKLVEKARNLIKKYGSEEIFISYGVIWETYCVLRSFYENKDEQILGALENILNADEFYIENETAVRLALAKAKKGQPFYDSLIGEMGALRNVKTYTFDKGLSTNKNFVVI
ncbi:MAG: PIN domain-containing protein [Candidatus Omnitrophica bacterium]|nr:PIN domain-containing protein [Candidatus Omnitrophota bacterium]